VTSRDETELFARRAEPDARAEIARRYDYLAQQLARKFRGRGVELDDLIQVARFGLLQALDRFDPDRGVKFSTFAGRTIVGEIKHHFRGGAWSIRVPRSLQNLWMEANQAIPELTQRLERTPTAVELAEHIDADPDTVIEALDAGGGFSAGSLDRTVGDDGGATVGDLVGTDHGALRRAPLWAEVEPMIKDLPDRERRVIYMRFFEGRTQSEIAEVIGVSQVHVSRILRSTLADLRSTVDEDT